MWREQLPFQEDVSNSTKRTEKLINRKFFLDNPGAATRNIRLSQFTQQTGFPSRASRIIMIYARISISLDDSQLRQGLRVWQYCGTILCSIFTHLTSFTATGRRERNIRNVVFLSSSYLYLHVNVAGLTSQTYLIRMEQGQVFSV